MLALQRLLGERARRDVRGLTFTRHTAAATRHRRRSIIIQNYVCMGIITLLGRLGLQPLFGASGKFIGDPPDFAMLNRVNYKNLPHEGAGKMGEAYVEGIPGLVFAAYQGMFAVITPALMTGAFAERIKFGPFLVFVVLWVHLVYFLVPLGLGPGRLAGDVGRLDLPVGWSCMSRLVSRLWLPCALPSEKNLGAPVDTTPHNVPYVALGTALLWFGWFGFNGGSALGSDSVAHALNTESAPV